MENNNKKDLQQTSTAHEPSIRHVGTAEPMDMDAGTMHNGRLGGNFDNNKDRDNDEEQNKNRE